MKKKLLVAAFALVTAFALTACGNPLKSLPEVGEDNLVDLVDDDEEGNPVAARILKELNKSDDINGDITEVTVYDREDGEDKDKSEIYVEVVSETDMAEYTTYHVVTLKYDKDDKEWRVKEIEADDDEDIQIEFVNGKSDEDIIDDIEYYEYYLYLDDGNTTYYVYLTDDTIQSYEISAPTVDASDMSSIKIDYDVTMSLKDGAYFSDVEGTVTYYFYSYSGGDEYLSYYDGTFDLVDKYIDPEIGDSLSDETMYSDFINEEYTVGYDVKYVISEDIITDYYFEDVNFYSDYAYRYLYVTCEPVAGAWVTYKVYLEYDQASDGSYTFDWSSSYISYAYDYGVTDDFEGTYSGMLYNDDDDACGTLELNVERTTEDGTFSGTLSVGGEETDVDGYLSTSSNGLYIYVSLDDSIYYNPSDKWDYIYSMYLYADPDNTGAWVTDSYSYSLTLGK